MSLNEGDSAAGLAEGWYVGADKLRGLGLLDLKVTSSRHVTAGGLGPLWQHVARKGPQEMDPAGTQASLATLPVILEARPSSSALASPTSLAAFPGLAF